MSLRRILCALLIFTMGSLALATEKPSAGKAKVPPQPKKPTLRLVQPARGAHAIRPMGGPDLVLEGPVNYTVDGQGFAFELWWSFNVKNRGTSIAGRSLVRVEGFNDNPKTCESREKTKTVGQLPAGTWVPVWLLAGGTCGWKVTVDDLNQVAESNENNNVYMIK